MSQSGRWNDGEWGLPDNGEEQDFISFVHLIFFLFVSYWTVERRFADFSALCSIDCSSVVK